MLRYAAVRADGTIARVLIASSEEAIDMNMPAGLTKIAAPDGIMFGTHSYDFATDAFQPVAQPSA